MNHFLHNDTVKELYCDNNLSYILNDPALFQTTEFKVLCHQHNSIFVDVTKMTFNGNIQLYYFTGKYIPMNAAVEELNTANVWTFITEIFKSLLEIKKVGFLSIRNVLTDVSHIFVDPTTNKIKWIYLPISNDSYKSEVAYEKEVLSEIKKEIMKLLNEFDSERMEELLADDLTLEQVIARVKNVSAVDQKRKKQSKVKLYLKIQEVNDENPLMLIDDQNEYLMGRKASAVDGVITSSKLIGRVHCKIVRNGYSFSVVDLQSINGTFVNGVKIRPNEMAMLSDGDILRLANKEFLICVEEGEDVNSQNCAD